VRFIGILAFPKMKKRDRARDVMRERESEGKRE
jgi:hypothetical protein